MGSMALLRALRDGVLMKSAAIIGSGDKIRNVFYRFSEQLQFSDKVTEQMMQTVEKQFGMPNCFSTVCIICSVTLSEN